jgi:uroporphyrinogen decarboxylase
MSFSSRDRVLCALNHEEPDRVPLFLGPSGATTVLGPGYEKLKAHLSIRGGPPRWISKMMQYARMDEEVLVQLGSDARPLVPGLTESTLRKEISADCCVDDWGIQWRRSPGTIYFEATDPPLRHATIDDLDRYAWPNLAPPGRFNRLVDEAKAVHQAGYATVLVSGITLFEQAYLMRGLDTILMDIAADPDFFTALLTKLKNLMLAYAEQLLKDVGPYVDVIVTGDDLGMTAGPMMSPVSYRRFIKPHQAELLGAIKQRISGKIFFHSCGNVYRLLGDLAEVGVDLLNPVQVSAGEMGDTARLKREFGNRLSFCGGIDTQHVLPCGTTDDVRREVRQRIKDLAPGGGYVAAAVHCIQPDVPPENIVAMCDEVLKAGRYPLQ